MAKNNAVEKLVKLGEYEAEPMVPGAWVVVVR